MSRKKEIMWTEARFRMDDEKSDCRFSLYAVPFNMLAEVLDDDVVVKLTEHEKWETNPWQCPLTPRRLFVIQMGLEASRKNPAAFAFTIKPPTTRFNLSDGWIALVVSKITVRVICEEQLAIPSCERELGVGTASASELYLG